MNELIALVGNATPCLIMDKGMMCRMLRTFTELFGQRYVHYAVKANSELSVLAFLADHGAGFEISSLAELNSLTPLNIPGTRMISATSIKTGEFIEAAANAGIDYFVVDSQAELEKVASYAPGSKVAVRLTVSNEGSAWPLERKFGLGVQESVEILEGARSLGLVAWGLSFHVGSQCIRVRTWEDAIAKARQCWQAAEERGIVLRSLNVGGGYPIEYTEAVPSIPELASVILSTARRQMPGADEILVEPGRALVGAAGTIVTSVIGKARREDGDWLYLDIGVFNGLAEVLGGIRYPMTALKRGELRKWKVAGPTCDSMDIISEEEWLPELNTGDKVLIPSAGAYTAVYASAFNGYPGPRVLCV